jgi:Phage protein (N4 Gp49/phage Sf6 gene 66) family
MTKTETDIETLIQAKGLTRSRLTPQDIDAVIKEETYTTLPSGKVMVCELTLLNGFTVRGEAAVVSKANFNEEIGRKISRDNARNKIWELEGYLLQDRLYQSVKSV